MLSRHSVICFTGRFLHVIIKLTKGLLLLSKLVFIIAKLMFNLQICNITDCLIGIFIAYNNLCLGKW